MIPAKPASKIKKKTIQCFISGYPVLALTEYIERHDNVCKYIHICIAKKYKFIQKIFQKDTITSLNHASEPIQAKLLSSGTIQFKLTDTLIITNPISSYSRKTPQPSQSLILQMFLKKGQKIYASLSRRFLKTLTMKNH